MSISKLIKDQNDKAIDYLTHRVTNKEAAEEQMELLFEELGNSVVEYPQWHPILTLATPKSESASYRCTTRTTTYTGIDHTVLFSKGFVTCPYNDATAQTIINETNKIRGLFSYKLNTPLYENCAFPVVVTCDWQLEEDGTLEQRKCLIAFVELMSEYAHREGVREHWDGCRDLFIGVPYSKVSSSCVSKETGMKMRKILKTLNETGMMGE